MRIRGYQYEAISSSLFTFALMTFLMMQLYQVRGESAKSCSLTGNQYYGYSFDCADRGFTEVPDDFTKNTWHIKLSNNKISEISPFSFSAYPNLTSLKIDMNQISRIDGHAFSHNTKLNSLDVSLNRLKDVEKGTFLSLKELKTLIIYGNIIRDFTSLTGEICQTNTEMDYLRLDVYDGFTFHDSCRNMSMIKTLIFDTRKKTRFRNDSLSYFEKTDIRELKIYGADGAFRPLEADFIRPLHSLESIVVDSFKMLTSYVFSRLLYPLQNRSLDKFYITHTYFDRIERLSGEALEYLPTICIKHLNIHNCQIQDIDFNRLRDSKLWSCLETFKIQENYFSMLGYFLIFTLGLPKISHIDACCQLVRQGTFDDSFDPLLRSSSEVKTQKRLGMLEIFLPNNTKYVSISDNDLSSNDFAADIFIHGNLEIIQLKNLRLGTCEGRIKGLQKLKVLEIRQWNCQTMNPEFITHLTSITNLSITKSNIGHNAKTFQLIFNLTYLTYLDFSENSFDELHPYFFQSQIQSLTNISFAENSFKAIPKALFVLKNLQFLDFRFNLISRLTSDEITFIDGLNDLKISLGGNALRCSCETLPFLHWVQENSHKIKDYDNLTCLYNNVPYIKISAVIGILHKLEISCISHIWLGISISALICLFLLVFLGFLLYKFQPDVRYVIARFRRTLRKLYQKEIGLPLLENMRYHAFVSYGNVNYTWACIDLWNTLTKDGFRLILRDRNFELGEYESTVILDAIDCSRRVIFVLTHDFLENEWNEYHIQIARLHAFRNETTNFIIVILIDDIPPHEIPKSLQRIWIRVKCLRWPKDGNRRSILSFWDELRNELTMD